MKKIALLGIVLFIFVACGGGEAERVEARAVYELVLVHVAAEPVNIADTVYMGSQLTFVGEEAGGAIIIRLGENELQAFINPSREHPSFAVGYWHHHLYAGATTPGSPRINFAATFGHLGIDDDPEATDNSQSTYQRGNLHYITETGEFRLRLMIDAVTHDLFFSRR